MCLDQNSSIASRLQHSAAFVCLALMLLLALRATGLPTAAALNILDEVKVVAEQHTPPVGTYYDPVPFSCRQTPAEGDEASLCRSLQEVHLSN